MQRAKENTNGQHPFEGVLKHQVNSNKRRETARAFRKWRFEILRNEERAIK